MLLTATEIDNNKHTIKDKLQIEVKKKIKSMLTSKVREFKKRKQTENEGYILTVEDKNLLKQEILDSDELKDFTEYMQEYLTTKTNNYFIIRDTLQDLNELNEFSAEMERIGAQTIDNFKSYGELVQMNLTYLQRFEKYKEIRKSNINKLISSYYNKKLAFSDTKEELFGKLHDIYLITKDADDIDVFDRFGMESNIDFSNKLSDIYFWEVANQDNKADNIVNNWHHDISNPIERVVKRQIISTKLLGNLLSTKKYISNNLVTCYENMYVTTKTNRYTYVTRTLGELLFDCVNPDLENIPKETRKQIYMTYDGTRPKKDEYHKWNGLQVFDIDLKEWNQVSSIETLKSRLFEYLREFHWFLWIMKSSSGRGLHIYTKVTPAHHVYTDVRDNEYICKYWHQVSYTQKVSIIYDCFRRISNDTRNNLKFNTLDDLKFIDNHMMRITNGVRLSWDNTLLVNQNFLDLHVFIGLSQTNESYYFQQSIDSVLFRDTKTNQMMLNNLKELCVGAPKETEVDDINLSKYEFAGDFSGITSIARNNINYTVRYNVVNTLAALFGKDGIPLAHKILQSEACKNTNEINSFYSCAISNKKKPSKIGLDILKKVGVLKTVKPEIKNTVDNIFKNGIKTAINKSVNIDMLPVTFELRDGQYLGDKIDYFLDPYNGGFTNEKINILLSPAGSGKTVFLLNLARLGKRILLVEPFISVIKNKVESDAELMQIFDVFYEGKSLNELDYGINAITTFDKFSVCNYDKISRMFDYICIDESHLLFTSSYRIEATSNAIRKIKELYYISMNEPTAAKLILMTGTETGDTYFFGDIANVIRVSKPGHNKHMKFLICNDTLDCLTRLAFESAELINKKYRLLIPTNKGEIYSQKLIGMIEYLLARPVKYGYYKRSNAEQEICQMINQYNTIGDYEIVFCSNYLSVGVDITDKDIKFASIYFGPFSGYEIEQFNARIRKTGIESIYCIQTESADGTTNDLLIEEPNLVLRITDDDIEHFKDDKQIAKAKQEFIAQYDPVLHKIVTPGFSYMNGAIRFNQEEYELVTFENKFLEAMVHPVKVARELSKYGYKITVSENYDGLNETSQEELRKISMESARNEKIRKHDLLIGTFIDLIDNNNHVTAEGLEFTDIILWIGKNKDKVFEDRDQEKYVDVQFNYYGNPERVIVKSKEALDSMWGCAKYIISKYSISKAKEIIYHYIDESGILKQKYFKRAINLLKLVDSADNNDLSEPMFATLEKLYDWMDKFQTNKNYRISYNTYMADVDAWTNSYIDMLKIKITSTYGYQKIKDNIIEMLNNLGTKNTTKDGIRFDYIKLPDEDSSMVKYRKSVDTLVENMFRITTEALTQNKRARDTHIILEAQPFN